MVHRKKQLEGLPQGARTGRTDDQVEPKRKMEASASPRVSKINSSCRRHSSPRSRQPPGPPRDWRGLQNVLGCLPHWEVEQDARDRNADARCQRLY